MREAQPVVKPAVALLADSQVDLRAVIPVACLQPVPAIRVSKTSFVIPPQEFNGHVDFFH